MGRHPWSDAAVVVATVLAMGVVGCLEGSARPPFGSACATNAECGGNLVCLFGRCRAACAVDRDCPEGTTCETVGGDPPTMACVLPGGGGLAAGEVCAADSECEGELVCERIVAVELYVCVETCSGEMPECPSPTGGALCVFEPETGRPFCTIDCDPVTGEPCGEGAHCSIASLRDDPMMTPALTHCTVATGDGVAGDGCVDSTDCSAGHLCSAGGTCLSVCEVPTNEGCSPGTVCTPFAVPAQLRGTEYGVCL